MTRKRTLSLLEITRLLLLALAATHVVLYLGVALGRASYPYELEWMEGAVLEHVFRIKEGLPLYGPPSLEFTPLIYTPLYYMVAALVGQAHLFALRAISIASSVASLLLILLLVRHETRRLDLGLLASGLFAATFGASGAWFDLARVDSLFLALLLGGIFLLRVSGRKAAQVAAAAAVTLAFLTKQTALPLMLPLVVYLALTRSPSRRRVFAGVFLALVVCATALCNAMTDGWFYYYVFSLPTQHPIQAETLWGQIMVGLVRPLPLALVLCLVWLAHLRRVARDRMAHEGLLLAGVVGVSLALSVRHGSFLNVFMPAHAMLAVGFACGVHVLCEAIQRQPEARLALRFGGDSVASCSAGAGLALVYIAGIVQLATLLYDPAVHQPTRQDREAGDLLVQRLSQIKGEILVPYHGYLARRAGKRPCAHDMAMGDVMRSREQAGKDRIHREVIAALEQARFAAVVVDTNNWYMTEMLRNYRFVGSPFESDDVFWPLTGRRVRPERLFLRDRLRPASVRDQ